MDRPISRKGQDSRKISPSGLDFSINEREQHINRTKYKRNVYNDKKKYEMSPKSYVMNWPPVPRMHHVPPRQFSTSDSSICHYSVPLSFSFEPLSFPVYPALIQPQGNCSVPLEVETPNRSKHHKSYSKNRQSKSSFTSQNDVPAIFHTPRINNGDQQDYTSLPPVNCDMFASKMSDLEGACRRRFSDPGIGQMSSDECSSSRSNCSSNSSGTAEAQNHDFFALLEQMNELKENNSHLKKELQEVKLELETLKGQPQVWRSSCDDFKPGALSDAISEIRSAVKLGEEALISKVMSMLEKNSIECKEANENLEERLKQEINKRISKIEEQINETSPAGKLIETHASERPEAPAKDPIIQQQLVELEQEKFQLRKELQEAVAKRKVAEASTEKLERLVGILRKKINGVSVESCIPNEKHVRPLASSLEKNPFIIANNFQGQKADTLPFTKPRVASFRAMSLENVGGGISAVNENKENETSESRSGNVGPANGGQTSEGQSVTAQVTITGPVTDL